MRDDYFDVSDVEYNNDWHIQRLGKITGSNFGKLVVSDKKGGYKLSAGKVAESLMYKIAWERLLTQGNISNGLGRLNVSSKEMQHGNDFEGQAVKLYEELTGNKVKYENEFVQIDEWIGGTPDGFIDEDGILEIKCPYNGGNHLKTLLTGEIYNIDYVFQIQGYLWITGRRFCDFCTYDPDLIDGLQLSINRHHRDEEIISAIEEIMEQVKAKIKEIINNDKLKK